MRISAIILSFNSAPFLERAIRSLAAELLDSTEADEIWVVDNGSTDESPRILRRLEEEFPNLLHCLYFDSNRGTTASRNAALRRSTGRFLLIMDSDIEVPKGTLGPLISRCERDPACGLVVPQLRYPSGRIQMSTDSFPTLGRKLSRLLFLHAIEANQPVPTEAVVVDYAISAFWLFRRDVLDEVGVLDERIFYSPEDVDYCLRVWMAGYRIWLEPSVFAVHHAQELSRSWRSPRFTLSHTRGLLYFFFKHGYFWSHRRLYRKLGR